MSRRGIQDWLAFRPWERHGLVLAVGGSVYILLGLIFMGTEEMTATRQATLELALRHAPLHTWGFVFFCGGVLAVSSSKWPRFNNSWGYMVLTGLASGWSAMYFVNYILNRPTLVTLGYGLVWGLLAFMWWAISGLVNPEEVLEVVADGDA